MTSTTTNPTALFQHYVQNIFVLPKELKNDIVYCQRALKAHIKVHQMVLDVYRTQSNPDPIQKKRIIDELESQIYEINAEQQFLLLRLRRVIDEFYKKLSRKNAVIIPELMNDVISRELVPLINDQKHLIYPISVRLRSPEVKLIEKYFEVKSDKSNDNCCFEVLDSEEEGEKQKIEQAKAKATIKTNSKLNGKSQYKDYDDGNTRQESLLKAESERATTSKEPPLSSPSFTNNDTFIDASQFLEVMDETSMGDLKGFQPVSITITTTTTTNVNGKKMKRKHESTDVYPVSIQESNVFKRKECEREDFPIPKNVKMSRFNLREALKKAHTDTLSKTSASKTNHLNGVAAPTEPRIKSETELLNGKRLEQSLRITRAISNGTLCSNDIKTIEINSSSGDSTPERSTTPQQSPPAGTNEIVDKRIKPEEFGQELFLRMFGLYTPEMRVQMQQRRSKRKRRNVQRNERADFHYGRIEYGSLPPVEVPKKPKVFLQSPQVKRKRGRPRKYHKIEKSDETSSRSSSSSPDEKRGCNECLKGGGSMEICEGCKGLYHQSCHREKDVIDINKKKAFFHNSQALSRL